VVQGGIVSGVLLWLRVGLIRNTGHGRVIVGRILGLVGWTSRNAHEYPLSRGYSHPQTCTPLHRDVWRVGEAGLRVAVPCVGWVESLGGAIC
jgi:hypothetical protein